MDADWFDELNEEQQADILIGIEQADKGETISHDEVVELFKHYGLR